MSSVLDIISKDPSTRELVEAALQGSRIVATGSVGSSSGLVAAAIANAANHPVLLLTAHTDDADEIEAELNGLIAPGFAVRFPALEASPGEIGVHIEQFADRLLAVERIQQHDDSPRVLVASIASLMQLIPPPEIHDQLLQKVTKGQSRDITKLTQWLADAGYSRLDAIEEPGQFALRGGILDIFPPTIGSQAGPIRLDFFGDEIDAINEIDLDTLGSDRKIESALLVAVSPESRRTRDGISLLDLLPTDSIAILQETLEIVEQGRGYFERVLDQTGIVGPPAVLKKIGERSASLIELNQFSAGAADADVRIDLPIESLPQFEKDASAAVKELAALASEDRVVLCCRSDAEAARARELITETVGPQPTLEIQTAYIHRGFTLANQTKTYLVPYHELLHRFDIRRNTARRIKTERTIDTFVDFEPGDYVVHTDHGIGKFLGLTVMKPKAKDGKRDIPEEFITLEFAGSSRLHVPCSQIDLVQRYIGGFQGKPPLSHLGGNKWKNQKARVAESVRDLAGEMLRVRAAREHLPGIQYPHDTAWQKEFEAEFPYNETEDQLAALAEIKKDMSSPRPMDRLICGDVGFGKTELAIRAAFKACEFGKQVAILVPTTVLAEQHERTFKARFADYPFKVESLSRFKTNKEVNQTLKALRQGKVDVIIGTHRLISKDVKFADLGLVVIDEEQRFGVEHKERLLQLRMTVDVMTLSATPIPRTLHMAMLGIRDISSLTTPPADRRAIVTEVIPANTKRIRQAIERELAREGQVYYVHNRVHNIQTVAADIQSLVPNARIVVGHGQMAAKELEQVMLTFMRKEADILIATTIIESGVDIPTANTMIINDADRFGLADLHQLRGRVGRYKHRAYCYLLLPNDRTVKEVAQKRLKAIEQYSMLGAGFKVAMRDLEIRGAGNILGSEQSGHIAAVGYDMFCRLLDQAVHDLQRAGEPARYEHISIDLGIRGIIPKAYIPSDSRRLEAYRRIATADSADSLDRARADLESAYGSLPSATESLIQIAQVRIALRPLGIRAFARRGDRLVFMTPEPDAVMAKLKGAQGSVSSVSAELAQTNARTPSGEALAEVYWKPPAQYLDDESLLTVLNHRLKAS